MQYSSKINNEIRRREFSNEEIARGEVGSCASEDADTSVRRYKAGQNDEGNNLDSSSQKLAHLSPPSP